MRLRQVKSRFARRFTARRTVAASLASCVVAAMAATNGILPALPQAKASTGCMQCSQSAQLPVNLASVVVTWSPGTDYTQDIPLATSEFGMVSNGDLAQLANMSDTTMYYEVDPTAYPGKLGGNGVGQDSLDKGTQSLVDAIVAKTNGDTSATILMTGYSQGAMLTHNAAVKLAALGYTNVYAIGIEDPDNASNGFMARSVSVPSMTTLMYGLDPEAVAYPSTGNYLEIGNEYDPYFRMSKYLDDPISTGLYFVPGLLLYHGAITSINYNDPLNTVVQNGNVTEYVIHDQWVPIVGVAAVPLQALQIPTGVLVPINDVLAGYMKEPLEATGPYALLPTPEEAAKIVQYTSAGIQQAVVDTIKLIAHLPLTSAATAASKSGTLSPVQQFIDGVLNGSGTSSATSASTTTDSSVPNVTPAATPVAAAVQPNTSSSDVSNDSAPAKKPQLRKKDQSKDGSDQATVTTPKKREHRSHDSHPTDDNASKQGAPAFKHDGSKKVAHGGDATPSSHQPTDHKSHKDHSSSGKGAKGATHAKSGSHHGHK